MKRREEAAVTGGQKAKRTVREGRAPVARERLLIAARTTMAGCSPMTTTASCLLSNMRACGALPRDAGPVDYLDVFAVMVDLAREYEQGVDENVEGDENKRVNTLGRQLQHHGGQAVDENVEGGENKRVKTLRRQLQHHGFEPLELDEERADVLLLSPDERVTEVARVCSEHGLTTVGALVRASREGSLPPSLRISDAVALDRVSKKLGKQFLWQSEIVLRPDFEAALSSLLLRTNWIKMSLEMLRECMEGEIGCCTNGDLVSCRVALGGALLRRVRDMDQPEAHMFMFSYNTVGPGCQATQENKASTAPVLKQCEEPCEGRYCEQHAMEEERRQGDWDPRASHPTLSEQERRRAWGIACRRYDLHVRARALSGDPAVGVSAVVGNAFRVQRPFVDLTAPGMPRYQMRRFDEEPVALPPHPCMLCEGVAFGRRDAWLEHVQDTHHGIGEYRQQLVFLSRQFDRVGRVPPQLWRHVADAFAEDYTTGAEDFSCNYVGWTPPSSAEPYKWSVAGDQRAPTSREYADCAGRIVKFICGKEPWALEQGVSLVALHAASLEIVRDVMKVAAPEEDGAVDSAVILRDLVLRRMEIEDLFHGEAAGDPFACLRPEFTVELWSRDLLQTLPEKLSFIAVNQLQQFFLGCPELDIEAGGDAMALAVDWGLRLLRHLRQRGILECMDERVSKDELGDRSTQWRLRTWWEPQEDSSSDLTATHVHKTAVCIDSLHGDPEAENGKGSGRRAVRSRVPCVVCARFGWERQYGYLWRQSPGSGCATVISHGNKLGKDPLATTVSEGEVASDGAAESPLSNHEQVAKMLDPAAYYERWRFGRGDDGDQPTGGIPLAELQASAVRDPDSKKLWLLHKKMFNMVQVRRKPWGVLGARFLRSASRSGCR